MKNKLKGIMLEKRNSLSKEEMLEKGRKIEASLLNLQEYKNSNTVMFFVSFNSEVNTHEMIKKALKEKIVAIPKVLQHEIEPSIILGLDNLVQAGRFGILEPIEIMKLAYKSIDIVLVPGIAFDKEGYRIGYGFGFYDKFLKKVAKAVKIGLCFDFQLVDKVPKEEHDVAVDFIITDERVIECRK